MNLFDWNKGQLTRWREQLERVRHPERYPNGIVCPKCGGTLYDTQRIYRGPPDEMQVKCGVSACDFKGRRYMELPDVRKELVL